jgi:hypothetical protein
MGGRSWISHDAGVIGDRKRRGCAPVWVEWNGQGRSWNGRYGNSLKYLGLRGMRVGVGRSRGKDPSKHRWARTEAVPVLKMHILRLARTSLAPSTAVSVSVPYRQREEVVDKRTVYGLPYTVNLPYIIRPWLECGRCPALPALLL